jgi:hypothetical protein
MCSYHKIWRLLTTVQQSFSGGQLSFIKDMFAIILLYLKLKSEFGNFYVPDAPKLLIFSLKKILCPSIMLFLEKSFCVVLTARHCYSHDRYWISPNSIRGSLFRASLLFPVTLLGIAPVWCLLPDVISLCYTTAFCQATEKLRLVISWESLIRWENCVGL